MIDVVFLLIVFFTLVINFAAADQNERIKLPVSETAQPPEQPPTEPITLHVLSDGHVIYNGVEYLFPELQKPVAKQVSFLKYMNVQPDAISVIIRADAECESRHVFDVVELCQREKLSRMVFRTRQQEE